MGDKGDIFLRQTEENRVCLRSSSPVKTIHLRYKRALSSNLFFKPYTILYTNESCFNWMYWLRAEDASSNLGKKGFELGLPHPIQIVPVFVSKWILAGLGCALGTRGHVFCSSLPRTLGVSTVVS